MTGAVMPLNGPALTMSSLEIAELVGSNHADVRRSMERLAEKGTITLPPLAEVSNPGPGPKKISVYHVSKRDSYVIVAQLSPEFTARLVDRWQELEAGAAGPMIPKSLPEALRLAADLADQKNKAEAALAIAAPKAAALDRIAMATDGASCLRVSAKVAQVPEKQYLQFLSGEHWIFRPHHSTVWQGYSDKEKAGLIELKRTKVTRDDGSEKTVEQVLITPRGQAKIAELIERKAPWLRKTRRPEEPTAGAIS